MTKQKSHYWLPVLALILANVLWGINVPIIKLGLKTVPVPILISLKFLAASLILLPFALKTWKPLKKKELGLMILSSLVWMTFTTVANNAGLQYAPSINMGVISLLGPLLLCMLSMEFLKERMSLKAFIGVIVAFAGASVIIGKPWEVSLSGQTVMLGNTLFMAAVLGGVVSTLLAKPVLNKISSYQATFLYILPGTLPVAAFALTRLSTWDIQKVNTGGYVAIIYGIVAVTAANLLFMYGLKFKKAHSVGIFKYIEPLVIIITAWMILGEHPSLKFAVGAILVFLGIYLAEIKTFTHKHLPIHQKG